MKTNIELVGILVMGNLLFAPLVWAQRAPNADGSRPETPGGRIYNPRTVETIRGEVMKVEKVAPMGGMGPGIHLQVQTDKETIAVHLGPAWYIDNQHPQIEPADRIQIRGSRIMMQDKPVIIAAEVRKGDQVLMLRDDNGSPVWAGWRRSARIASAASMMGANEGRGGPAMMGANQGMMEGGQGMMRSRPEMMQHVKEMMQARQKLLAEMKTMDAALDQKVKRMDEAQGNPKVEAMAAVIDELVKQRETTHRQMAALQERMTRRMERMHQMMEGSGRGNMGTEMRSQASR